MIDERNRVRAATIGACLLTATALMLVDAAAMRSALAQGTSSQRQFSIPAGSLSAALVAYGQQAGIQVSYVPSIASGLTTGGVSGAMTSSAALARLLGGTGLSYRFTGSAVLIERPASDVSNNSGGAIALDTIDVSGGRVSRGFEPFRTPGAVSVITQENIEHFRGTSPGEMFQGTPGVMSGENHNSGAVDVNIRGMQGMGRVAVTVDGAMNSTTVYQGYQGIGNRTYVDPDLLSGVAISKGPDAASAGIAGTVAMETLKADDIVQEGKTFGIRARAGVGTNTTNPPLNNTVGGITMPGPWAANGPTSKPDGMDRPGVLTPTSEYGNIALATKQEKFDIVAAYARRIQGNYFAGTKGPSANPVYVGNYRYCTLFCYDYTNYYMNTGLTQYRAGEEVLNTSQDTESFLAKTTLRFTEDHALNLGYVGYRSEHGERRASENTLNRLQYYQKFLAKTNVDTGTAHYRWKPAGHDLIDFNVRAWMSEMDMLQPTSASFSKTRPLGLPDPQYNRVLIGSHSKTAGGEATNTSKFATAVGPVSLNYGVSYLDEDTKPTKYTIALESPYVPRNGERKEIAAYAKGEWSPLSWLTLNSGLRYQSYETYDRSEYGSFTGLRGKKLGSRSGDGFSPSAGVTLKPFEGVQVYANYAQGLRMPSLMESTTGFNMYVFPDVKPETAHNWELGINVLRDSVFFAGDKTGAKFSYFHSVVDNYISRWWSNTYGLVIDNIYQARFEGLELTTRYELNGFKAELGANYYTDIQFCRTAETCASRSLYADYGSNHVPPEYTVSLTLSQKMLQDRLTIGGRILYVGPRAVDEEPIIYYSTSPFIDVIEWRPYTLVDLFADYKISDYVTANITVQNLTDRYYVDPLSLSLQPSPGRTIRYGLTAKF